MGTALLQKEGRKNVKLLWALRGYGKGLKRNIVPTSQLVLSCSVFFLVVCLSFYRCGSHFSFDAGIACF